MTTTTRLSTLAAVTLLAFGGAGCASQSPAPVAPASAPASSHEDPYDQLPVVPSLTVSSESVGNGQAFAIAQQSGMFGVPGGGDQSPQISWSGLPSGTKSVVVSMYDPDAPTGSGFWHWAVYNVPTTTTSLPAGAGTPQSPGLPAGAKHALNDAGQPRYLGAAPPKGTTHRYFLTVTALDVEQVPVEPNTTPELLGFTINGHTLARGHLIATATGK